jgi:hypothetical protein
MRKFDDIKFAVPELAVKTSSEIRLTERMPSQSPA